MRALILFSMALAVVLASCKSHKPVAVPAGDAGEIPREVAVQKLGELLPTAEYVYCSVPKESLKPSDIKLWSVVADSVQMEISKGRKLHLSFGEMVDIKLELSGKYYIVKVYTTVLLDRNKDHFQFLWKVEDRAKQVTELLLSLKKK